MGQGRTRPAALLLTVLLAVLTVAGCGSDPSGSPSATDSTRGAPGSSSAGSPGPPGASTDGPSVPLPTSRVRAAVMHRSVLGRSVADTAQEKAVVEAWMAFWQSASDTFFYAHRDADLDRLADAQARDYVLGYLHDLRSHQQRVVGWAKDNVVRVQVAGARATVRDCTENNSFQVDEEGAPIDGPTPFYDVTGTLEQHHGRWVVTEAHQHPRTARCPG
jgi:hypothetical protein